jgi:uncharacterized membrane protein
MRVPVMFYVAITTFLLVMLTIMVAMEINFDFIFYTMCLGQAFVMVLVYKVLKDNYTTNKTFDDLYEDNPITYKHR